MATNTQDPIVLSIFRWDDPNHPLNHTNEKRAYLKRILPHEKFEQLMRLTYIDDMPPSLIDDDHDSENVVHEEGLNEMLTGFFGDGTMIIWMIVTMAIGVVTSKVMLKITT